MLCLYIFASSSKSSTKLYIHNTDDRKRLSFNFGGGHSREGLKSGKIYIEESLIITTKHLFESADTSISNWIKHFIKAYCVTYMRFDVNVLYLYHLL